MATRLSISGALFAMYSNWRWAKCMLDRRCLPILELLQNVSNTYRRNYFFELCARKRFDCLVLYESVEVCSFSDSGRAARCILLLAKWASIEVPIWSAALVLLSQLYLRSKIRYGTNSWLWVLVYTGWAAFWCHQLLRKLYGNRRLWYLRLILGKHIKALDLYVFFGGSFNASKQQYLMFVIEFVDGSTIPIANNNCPIGAAGHLCIPQGASRWLEVLSNIVTKHAKYSLWKSVCRGGWNFCHSRCLRDLIKWCQQNRVARCTSFSSRSTQTVSLAYQLDAHER